MGEDIVYKYTEKVIKQIVKKDDEYTRKMIKEYVKAKYPNEKVRIDFYDEETIDKIIDLGINALNSEKTVHTCLHCGNDTPLYCEKCQQELISKNAELQSDNYEIKNTYRRTAQHLNNIGKTELADYMLAQINDVPVWCVGDDKNFIPKQVIRDKLDQLKDCDTSCLVEQIYNNGKKSLCKELLGD